VHANGETGLGAGNTVAGGNVGGQPQPKWDFRPIVDRTSRPSCMRHGNGFVQGH
jgi:hypothetical protein